MALQRERDCSSGERVGSPNAPASTVSDPIAPLLAELVRVPSVNPMLGGSGEAALARWVGEWLRATGAEVELQPVHGERCNVIAAIGPANAPALLLEAHLDTVAPAGDWTRDPFTPVVQGGRLYGLGACDTKGSLATFLHLFAELARAPRRLRRRLVLAATVDEEVGQTGAYALMGKDLALRGAFVGEPTDCRVVHAHKGFVRFRVETTGRAAHSSRPEQGDNAIERMSGVVQWFREYGRTLAQSPCHGALGRPTVNVGTIAGGVGVNTVPDRCVIQVDRRTVPGETLADVQAELAALGAIEPSARIFEVLERPAVHTPAEAPLVRQLVQTLQACGEPAGLEAVPYLTNAVAYAAAGVPVVVFGPGDLTQAHRPDEFIQLAELERCARVLRPLLERELTSSESELFS